MIDPHSVTCYTLNKEQLEEFLLFSVCVAGKTALNIARSLDKVLNEAHERAELDDFRPLDALRPLSLSDLQLLLKKHGVGCHSLKAQCIKDLCDRNFDLTTVSHEELERVFGIGPKTARFFILHTRPDADVAALDTHILKFMRDLGYDAPRSTPGHRRLYREWELIFVGLARRVAKRVAEFDLEIWKAYSSKDEAAKQKLLDLFRPKEDNIDD